VDSGGFATDLSTEVMGTVDGRWDLVTHLVAQGHTSVSDQRMARSAIAGFRVGWPGFLAGG
jgi:hypothetical protein